MEDTEGVYVTRHEYESLSDLPNLGDRDSNRRGRYVIFTDLSQCNRAYADVEAYCKLSPSQTMSQSSGLTVTLCVVC